MQAISWYVPGYVLYAYHAGILEMDELQQADNTVVDILRGTPDHDVILISDHRDVVENKVPLYKMVNMLNFAKEPNLNTVVSVQNSNAFVYMGKIFTQVMGLKYQFVNSLDDAVEFLKQQYPDIPWEEADASVFTQTGVKV